MFTSSHDHMMLQCYPHNNKPMDRKWIKSNVEVAPNCPRCASPNTKFCYYNNYSFLQPRYFCKGCRRYWTKGGSLRNVPVGGGCRKSRRSTKGVNNKADSPWRSGNNSYNPDLTGNHSTCNSSSSSPSTGIDSIVANDQHQQLGNKDGDIDLAAVFAKFLNQESSLEAKFLGQDLVDVSYSSDPASQLTKESQNPAASIPGFGQLLEGHWPSEVFFGEDPPQNLQLQGGEGTDHEVVEIGDASGGFGIPSDGNEMVQIDAGVWTEAENLESFPWQLPMTQLQDFDSFSVDDHQLEVSAELISDVGNWSSFDLLGFEHFPTL